ncbi:DUF4157 domain-containing protein [Moorena sp. SIO1G6]|uniref:eCIS core domain-containing protein n=1 Tax=Moorena sp. SIO1G6 TaxID=2607840 RepID=UPI00257DB83F|nr:DUF4157 domain-containing protein [Moorena sp. SIO1G6]
MSFDQNKKDSRRNGYRDILEAEEREWNAEDAVGEWGSISAKVMRTLESGQYQPDTGRYKMGLQAKLSCGQPGDRSRQGANHGGQMVVQPKRNMVQRAAQPLTGDTLTYGESMRALRRDYENKTGLPDRLKAGIENLSGYSMDDVRVHYNSVKPAQLQALAYAQGTEIHVGPGQEKHLPHEAWHVVQQKQGRVMPTMQLKGGVKVNEEAGLEKEANEMGMKAQFLFTKVMSVQSKAVQKSPKSAHVSPPIQRNGEKDIQQADTDPLDLSYNTGLFFNGVANLWEHNTKATLFARKTAFLMGISKLGMASKEYAKNGELNLGTYTNSMAGLMYITEGIGETMHLMEHNGTLYKKLLKIAPLAGAFADFVQIPKYLKKEDYLSAAMYGGFGYANIMMYANKPLIYKRIGLGIGLGMFAVKNLKDVLNK